MKSATAAACLPTTAYFEKEIDLTRKIPVNLPTRLPVNVPILRFLNIKVFLRMKQMPHRKSTRILPIWLTAHTPLTRLHFKK